MILVLSLGMALSAVVSAATAQNLPAPPSGFLPDAQVAQYQAKMRATGASDGVKSTKANDNMSECYSDPKILFSYGWSLNPAAKTTVDMMIKGAPDPSERSPMGYFDEAVIKQAYKNGVLEWRKQTWPVSTGHPCKDKQVVFYNGYWVGYAGNKLISISVDRLYNSKEKGQAWIDEYIDKLMGALNSK
jgi:hypothetical protein